MCFDRKTTWVNYAVSVSRIPNGIVSAAQLTTLWHCNVLALSLNLILKPTGVSSGVTLSFDWYTVGPPLTRSSFKMWCLAKRYLQPSFLTLKQGILKQDNFKCPFCHIFELDRLDYFLLLQNAIFSSCEKEFWCKLSSQDHGKQDI